MGTKGTATLAASSPYPKGEGLRLTRQKPDHNKPPYVFCRFNPDFSIIYHQLSPLQGSGWQIHRSIPHQKKALFALRLIEGHEQPSICNRVNWALPVMRKQLAFFDGLEIVESRQHLKLIFGAHAVNFYQVNHLWQAA